MRAPLSRHVGTVFSHAYVEQSEAGYSYNLFCLRPHAQIDSAYFLGFIKYPIGKPSLRASRNSLLTQLRDKQTHPNVSSFEAKLQKSMAKIFKASPQGTLPRDQRSIPGEYDNAPATLNIKRSRNLLDILISSTNPEEFAPYKAGIWIDHPKRLMPLTGHKNGARLKIFKKLAKTATRNTPDPAIWGTTKGSFAGLLGRSTWGAFEWEKMNTGYLDSAQVNALEGMPTTATIAIFKEIGIYDYNPDLAGM